MAKQMKAKESKKRASRKKGYLSLEHGLFSGTECDKG